jgi:TolA-binding protein
MTGKGMKVTAIMIALVAMAGWLVSTGAKAAPPEGMCIEQTAIDAVESCPKGAKKFGTGKKSTAPKSVFSGDKSVKTKVDLSQFEKSAKGPGVTGIQEQSLAQLRAKKQKLADDLLKKELMLTKKLIKNMSDNDQKKPDAFFRIAELNFELQQNFGFKAMALDDKIFEAKQKNDKVKWEELKKKQKAMLAKSEEYRMDAIKAYAQLVSAFPDYERMDEALFYLGYSLDEIARTFPEKKVEYASKARDIYKKLIKEYPGSKYVPNAYLSFAEFYFNDGDMGNALKFYKEVAKYEDSNIYGFAIYKQAWCLYNMQDYKGTIEKFVNVIDYAKAHPEDPNAGALLKQARMELVMPYAQIGTPDHAWEFFQKYGEDMAQKEMQGLAENYFGQGMWPEAIATYHKLMEIAQSDDAFCDWQYWVTFATNSLKKKDDQFTELERLAATYKMYAEQGHPGELKQECLKKASSMILDQAIYWHREAVGTDTQPGTNDPQTMKLASDTYNLIVKEFPDLDSMPQEGDSTQRVTLYKIAYYKAELLWKMEDWVKCGPAFDAVVDMNPEGEYTSDAAYASVLCYNNLYHMYHKDDKAGKYTVKEYGSEEEGKKEKEKKGKGKKKGKEVDELAEKVKEYEPKKISSTEEKMLEAFSRYTCYVQESEDLSNIKYRKCRIYYEANQFEEAAYCFKDVAHNFPNSEVGIFAANLYLDALNSIRTWNDLLVEQENQKGESADNAVVQKLTDKKLACGDTLTHAVDEFITDPKLKSYLEDPEFADIVYTVKCNIERLRAEDFHKNKQFKESALTYYSLYKKWGQQCTNAKLDEVLYNMAIEFEAARLIGAAIKARMVLISDERFEGSEWSKRALYFIGQNYHAIALYEKAADFYEAFAKKYSGEPEAPEALQNATFFRLGLGQDDKAIDNALLFQKNYTSGKMKRPAEVAMVFFGIGSIYRKNKNWGKVIDHYNSYNKKYKSPAAMDFQIRASMEIADAYWQMKKLDQAEKYCKEVTALYEKDPMSKIEWVGSTPEEKEADKAARGRLMFSAVAQARFYLGEIYYQKFKDIDFPQFKPDKIKNTQIAYSDDPEQAKKEKDLVKVKFYHQSKEDWEKYVNWMKFQTWTKKELSAWQKKKDDAMKKADAFFADTVKIGIEQWEIAAAARHGDMYREFFTVLYDAPVPDIIKEDPDMLDAYNDTRDQMALSYKTEAVAGFEHCLEKSKEKRWFNEWSLLCEQELNKLDPKAYPISAEIRTPATLPYLAKAEPKLIDKLLTAAEQKEKKIEVGAGLESAAEESGGTKASEDKGKGKKGKGKGKKKGK